MHIIDNDGEARVSLEPTVDGSGAVAYSKGEFQSARIPVFWAGGGTPGDVHYTVGPPPDGMTPATEGVDYEVTSQNPLRSADFTHAGGRVGFI